jgi:hypothetical protein
VQEYYYIAKCNNRTLERTVLWDVTSCNSVEFHYVSKERTPFIFTVKICYANKKQAANRASLPHYLRCYVLNLLFDSDDGGSIFLRNIDEFL